MNLTCIDVIRDLIRINSNIEDITFVKFNTYNQLQGRVNFEKNFEHIFNSALKIKNQYNLPFWDSFNVSTFNQKINDFSFLQEVTFHNKPGDKLTLNKDNLEDFIKKLNFTDDYWTISSKTTLRNEQSAHFFFLDFHIPVNDCNKKICIEIAKNLGLKGYLLDSGKSYHFYSNNLITEDELLNKLAYSLLYTPIVDRAWIAHQIIQRQCCLRISKKYDRLPLIVANVE